MNSYIAQARGVNQFLKVDGPPFEGAGESVGGGCPAPNLLNGKDSDYFWRMHVALKPHVGAGGWEFYDPPNL